jgi:molybdopterin molybdotransferase
LPIDEAIDKMREAVTPLTDTQIVPLLQAKGRILSSPVISTVPVPAADNSAMDGYAMRYQDLIDNDRLTLVGTALAGQPFTREVLPMQCVRIMTGAIIPQGANAVVMQENTQKLGDSIIFQQSPELGNSIRRAGEDIQLGQVVVPVGSKLKAAYLALIASVGVANVSVYRKLKVGLIATGDELVTAGRPLPVGCVYESNRIALMALLQDFAVDVIDYGIVKDDKSSLRATFEQADLNCDLVISCGGVSVGDADFVKEILDEQGQVNFWQVAIKPGKPFAFGRLQHAWFCGLPGNPVSSYVTFEQLVVPVLQELAGQNIAKKHYFVAKAAQVIRKQMGRAEFQRGFFYRDEQDQLWVKPQGKQGSGIMSSLANANCYMVLSQGSANIEIGQSVTIHPFNN